MDVSRHRHIETHRFAIDGKQILVVGDPVAGFSFVGSFDDSEDAIRYADNFFRDEDWWVTDLVDPDDPPDEATDHDELTDDEKTALRCELDDLLPRGEASARSVAAGAARAGEASD